MPPEPSAVDPQRMRVRSRPIELHRRIPLKHTDDLQPLLDPAVAPGADGQKPKKKPPPIPTPPIFVNARNERQNFVPYKPPDHYVCWNQRNGATLISHSDFFTASHREIMWLRRYLQKVAGDPNNMIMIPVASPPPPSQPQNAAGQGVGASSVSQGLYVTSIEERVRRMKAASAVSRGAGAGRSEGGISGDGRADALEVFLAEIPPERLAAMEAIIELFERGVGLKSRSRLADCSREYMVQLAKSDAADKLGVTGRFVTDVYNYWISARKELKKPLLRVFQPPPQPENPSPHVAFRPRQSHRRISTRHPKRNDQRDVRRLRALQRDFQQMQRIIQMCRQREQLKIAQVQLAADQFYHQLQNSQLGLWVASAIIRKPLTLTHAMLQAPPRSGLPTLAALGSGPCRAVPGQLYVPPISSTVIQLLSLLRSPIPACRWGFDVHLRPGLGSQESSSSGGGDRSRKRGRRSRGRLTKVGGGSGADLGFDGEDELSEATDYSENSDDELFFAGLEHAVFQQSQMRAALQPISVETQLAGPASASEASPSSAAAASPASSVAPVLASPPASSSAAAAPAPGTVSLGPRAPSPAAAAAVSSESSEASAAEAASEADLERLEHELYQTSLLAKGMVTPADLQPVLSNPHAALQAALADAALELEHLAVQRGHPQRFSQLQQLLLQKKQQVLTEAVAASSGASAAAASGQAGSAAAASVDPHRMVIVDSEDDEHPPPLVSVPGPRGHYPASLPQAQQRLLPPHHPRRGLQQQHRQLSFGLYPGAGLDRSASTRSSTSEDDYSSPDDDYGFPFSAALSPCSTALTATPPSSPPRAESAGRAEGAALALPDGTQVPLPPPHYAYGLYPADDDGFAAQQHPLADSGHRFLRQCLRQALNSSSASAASPGGRELEKLRQLIENHGDLPSPERAAGQKRRRAVKQEYPPMPPLEPPVSVSPSAPPHSLPAQPEASGAQQQQQPPPPPHMFDLLKNWMWTGGYASESSAAAVPARPRPLGEPLRKRQRVGGSGSAEAPWGADASSSTASTVSADGDAHLAKLAARVSEQQLDALEMSFAASADVAASMPPVTVESLQAAPRTHLLSARLGRSNRLLVDACRINPDILVDWSMDEREDAPLRRGRRRRQPPARLAESSP